MTRQSIAFEQLVSKRADVGFMLERREKVPAPSGRALLAEILDDWVDHREGEQGLLEALNPPLTTLKPPPWDDAWHSRRRAGRVLLVSLGALSFVGISWDSLARSLCALLALLGTAGLVVSAVRLATFTCPRCGRRFDAVQKTRRLRVTNPFTHRCLYCGLEIGQRS